ncbi:MAG: superoxide dismutase family protein [Lachnospiraceae bacterium]
MEYHHHHQQTTPRLAFLHQLQNNHPQAVAWVRGQTAFPGISGLVKFYNTPYGGVLVEAEVFGLPNIDHPGSSDFYAMHIHEVGDCSQDFIHTGEHYNPQDIQHPYHAGDLLPLLGSQGYAYSVFYTKRFQIRDILDRSVIIHAGKDDFTTQPSGNSGMKIACGVIRDGREG